LHWLGRTLAEGFGYQGEISAYRDGKPRGQRSTGLPPNAFVNFLQDHDQIGNRALGERLCALVPPAPLRLAVICMLLAPSIPMLFMGEEFAATSPFLFFCNFGPELADKVVLGRRQEFAAFERFRTAQAQASIPDPGAQETFSASKLNWGELVQPAHGGWHTLYSHLLELRRRHIVPHLAGESGKGRFAVDGTVLAVDWTLGDRTRLHLRANFSGKPGIGVPACAGAVLFAEPGSSATELGAWCAQWTLEAARG
jgi:1,4-alpha-glucan branching enzyme